MLRLSTLDGFSIAWVPDIAVRAQTEFAHLTRAERRRKLRYYARRRICVPALGLPGVGKVPLRAGRCARTATHAPQVPPLDGVALAIGRTEGVLGRVLSGSSDNRAILR